MARILSDYERRARASVCTRCGAGIGESCRSVTGTTLRPHAPRRQAAGLPPFRGTSAYDLPVAPPARSNPLFRGRPTEHST